MLCGGLLFFWCGLVFGLNLVYVGFLQTSKALRKYCSDIGTTLQYLGEGTPWVNKSELFIGLIKEAVRKYMTDSDRPFDIWYYCVERWTQINNLTANITFSLHGYNAYAPLTGREGGISNLCQYKWYDWCYYREHKVRFPFKREVLGQVLGPTTGAGNYMAQWILKSNGYVVPRQNLIPLHIDELQSPEEQKKWNIFGALIERRWGTSINLPPVSTMSNDEICEEHEDEDESARIIPDIKDTADSNGRQTNQQPAYNKLINTEVQLQHNNEMRYGKAKK